MVTEEQLSHHRLFRGVDAMARIMPCFQLRSSPLVCPPTRQITQKRKINEKNQRRDFSISSRVLRRLPKGHIDRSALFTSERANAWHNIRRVAPAVPTRPVHGPSRENAVPGISMESAKGGDDGLMSVSRESWAGGGGEPTAKSVAISLAHLSAQRDSQSA